MLSTEESQDRMDDADTDEDGKVSWDEIMQDSYGTDAGDLEPDDKLISDDKATFDAADMNKDGYLDIGEFKAYTHPEETPRMFPLLLEQALEDKDRDKDGFISFQEFLGMRAKSEDKEWLLVEKDKFDHEHDKNGDGRLDSTEILAWLVPSNELVFLLRSHRKSNFIKVNYKYKRNLDRTCEFRINFNSRQRILTLWSSGVQRTPRKLYN